MATTGFNMSLMRPKECKLPTGSLCRRRCYIFKVALLFLFNSVYFGSYVSYHFICICFYDRRSSKCL